MSDTVKLRLVTRDGESDRLLKEAVETKFEPVYYEIGTEYRYLRDLDMLMELAGISALKLN